MAGPKEFYDGLASEYHVLFEDWWRAAMWHGKIIASLLAARGVPEHSRVLDCTCGIGTQALPLAVLGYNVTGTDLSHRSVERARWKLKLAACRSTLRSRTYARCAQSSWATLLRSSPATTRWRTCSPQPTLIKPSAMSVPAYVRVAFLSPLFAITTAWPSLVPGIPIALHGPTGERQGAGQTWVWSPGGDQVEVALFTLAESPDGAWNAAVHETTLEPCVAQN